MEAVKRGPGRPKTVDKEELKRLAQSHAPTAMKVLVGVATKSKSPAARVAAANSIIDRAFGKASQPMGQDPDLPNMFENMMKSIAGHQSPVIKR